MRGVRDAAALSLLAAAIGFGACTGDSSGPAALTVPVVSDSQGIVRPGKARDPVPSEVQSVEVGADDRRLTVQFLGGSPACWSVERVAVELGRDRVGVVVFGGYHALPKNTVCPAVGVIYTVSVRLGEPVAGRHVG